MLKRFYPGEYVDSTYSIDFEELFKQGYRGVIFDIDNTLVKHGEPATKQAIDFFDRLRKIGFHTCAISNNQEPRVKPFADNVGTMYVSNAHKPSTVNYHKACHMMGVKKEECVFVGDQLFTDVWGANRAGIRTYLVKPIDKKEEIQIILKRYLERIVLFFYERSKRNN